MQCLGYALQETIRLLLQREVISPQLPFGRRLDFPTRALNNLMSKTDVCKNLPKGRIAPLGRK